MPGRVRYRVPALRNDPSLKRRLEAKFGGDGVRSLSANIRTASVLILYAPSRPLEEIERRLQRAVVNPTEASAGRQSQDPAWHAMDAGAVLAALGSAPHGLSTAAYQARRRRWGLNALEKLPPRSRLVMLLAQFRNLPAALLAGTAVLSLMTGGTFDAALLLAVLALNGAVGFFCETWTEHAIASLESGEAPPVRVHRDGAEIAAAIESLVPGDVIEMHRDDIVPADGRLIAADRLTINEAALTGESMPVAKAANVLGSPRASIGERRNMVFRGSMVTGGSGRAVIVATGDRTEIGRVQALLANARQPETQLQQQLDRLGRQLVLGAAGAAGLTLLLGLGSGRNFLALLRSAVSLGVAAVPEGLPMMVTTMLAVGAGRLTRRDLLVRRLEAIEALGSVQIVCFDKTGTLTLNRMTATQLVWNGDRALLHVGRYQDAGGAVVRCENDPDLARLLEICVLCSDVQFVENSHAIGSPTETALIELAHRFGFPVATTLEHHPRLASIERAEGRRYMATLHVGGEERIIAVKGDPAAVLDLCGSHRQAGETRPLDGDGRSTIMADNLAMAETGLRVLGIAWRAAGVDEDILPEPPSGLIWLGLVGMADPPRRGAADLVQALHRAGIATAMLTGDQPATARAIARDVGLSNGEAAQVVEADDLDRMPSLEPGMQSRIFARLAPAQKLQIVAKLQRSGLRVAMIGDGVNDSPALKVADVGITLGASATPVARDMADIVLLGDDLSPLINAFATGRSVRRNARRAIHYLIATNLSEILLMLFATATGMVRPLTPAQLLWINLATDVLPAMGLALEPPTPEASAPTPADTPILSGRDLGVVARDAAIISGSALAAELVAASRRGADSGAAVGFASLVAGQLLYALTCSAPGDDGRKTILPSPLLTGTLAASFAIQGAALFVPGLRALVEKPLSLADLPLTIGASLAPLLLTSLQPQVDVGLLRRGR